MENVDLHWCKEALNETISQICSSKSLLLECFWWASTWKASGHRMYPANAMVSYFHRWAWPHGATFLVGFAAISEKLFEDASSEFRSEYKSMHACIHAYMHMRNHQNCWWRSLLVRRSLVLKVAPNHGKRCGELPKKIPMIPCKILKYN